MAALLLLLVLDLHSLVSVLALLYSDLINKPASKLQQNAASYQRGMTFMQPILNDFFAYLSEVYKFIF